MKRLKRIICLSLALAIVMSGFVAFAESRRINPRHVKKPLNRMTENTVMLYDFTNCDPGSAPIGFGSNANVTTGMYDVGDGYVKNCLVATDTTHDNSYTGPSTSAPLAATEGIVSVEMRYKYLPLEPSNYASVIWGFDKGGKRVSRFTIASANGASIYCDKHNLEGTRIFHDTWYTLRVVFDFDEGVTDAYLTNEATKVTKSAKNVEWYTAGNYDSLDAFGIQGMAYGGTWIIDYIRQEKNAERNSVDENIEKGCPQINIPSPVTHSIKGRTNITLDGKYKYTTVAPVVNGDGKVLATGKNIARILGLTYTSKDGALTVSSKDKEYKLTVIENTSDGQSMVAIEDVAKAFGIGYEYNKDTNTVVLTTGKETKADE